MYTSSTSPISSMRINYPQSSPMSFRSSNGNGRTTFPISSSPMNRPFIKPAAPKIGVKPPSFQASATSRLKASPRINSSGPRGLNRPGESKNMCRLRVTSQKVGENASLGMAGGFAAGGIHGSTAGGVAGATTGFIQGARKAYKGCK